MEKITKVTASSTGRGRILRDDQCGNGCGTATAIRTGVGRLKITGYRCRRCGYSWNVTKPWKGSNWTGSEIPGTSHAAGYHE